MIAEYLFTHKMSMESLGHPQTATCQRRLGEVWDVGPRIAVQLNEVGVLTPLDSTPRRGGLVGGAGARGA